MITGVYIFANGMVLVFDEDGKQLTDIQGRFGMMAPKISQALHAQGNSVLVEIFMARWGGEKIPIPNLESFDRLWRTTE